MNMLIPQIRPNTLKQLIQSLRTPTKDSSKRRLAHRLYSLQQILLRDGTKELILLASRPGIDGHVDAVLHDIDEARVPHVLPPVLRVIELPSDEGHGFY